MRSTRLLTALLLGTALALSVECRSAESLAPGPSAKRAFNPTDPVYPVNYSEAQKTEQRATCRAVIKQINAAIKAGEKSFIVPPGVYRMPAKGPDHEIEFGKINGFTLNLANTEFILERGGFIFPQHCENIAIIGPVKFDADPLVYSQGTIIAYESATGLATVNIWPGYKVDIAPKGTVDVFSPDGVYLENPSWAKYTDAKTIDVTKGQIQVALGSKKDIFTNIYKPGNCIVLRNGGPNLIATRDVHNLTLQDADIYTGAGLLWGGGSGDWKFIRVRGIPRPGTNRLLGAGGCQAGNYGGSVLFDACEFAHTTDDLVDFYGGGIFMCQAQSSPREVVTWGGTLTTGDTINFYARSDFHPAATAVVTAVSEFKDDAVQADAHRLAKTVLKARDVGDRKLHRVSLDRDIHVAPADFVENGSANRPDLFTIRNCFFHDCGVRVLVQGFKRGVFENNRFEKISGGFALTCDAWWWEGPTCQDIAIRNNVFAATTFRNAWGTGKAAIVISTGNLAPADTSRGVAIHRVVISGNTISDSSAGGIFVSNAADVTVKDNVISSSRGRAIHLETIQSGAVETNSITDCALQNIRVDKSSDINVNGNHCDNAGPFADATNAIVFNASRNTTAEKNHVTTNPGARPPETKPGN